MNADACDILETPAGRSAWLSGSSANPIGQRRSAAEGVGVVKSLGGSVFGPVGFIREQKFQFFKNEKPTSVVESYKTTYGHKAVVLMSDVEGRAEKHFDFDSSRTFACRSQAVRTGRRRRTSTQPQPSSRPCVNL